MTLEPAPSMPPVVDDRPSLTDWIANVHGANLLEGRLELEVIANSQHIGAVLTDELVFSGVDQKVRILLPAYNWSIGADEIIVKLKLHTKGGVLRLPEQRLRTSLPRKRKFPLLMGETKQRPRSTLGRDRLADRLRFESLLTEEQIDHAITVSSHMTANDFPRDSLAYCSYEVVVAAGDVFTALRGDQLDALLNWVRAGGSLYLEPAGILESGHVEFLNRLAADDPRQVVFSVDDKGRLPPETFSGDDGFLHLSPGLGRAVLGLPSSDETAIPEPVWRSVAATLWKIRDDQRNTVINRPPQAEPREAPAPQPAMVPGANPFEYPQQAWNNLALNGPPLSDVVTNMVDWLRPQGVRMVPLWIIGALLGMLVIVIGPVDYVVLGWMRRRKWTWITFPVAVVFFTMLTVSITNSYLSSAEARKAFVMHDVADDGEIVRTNRFELVFTSATRRLNTEVQAALFTPLYTGGTMDPRYGNVRSQRVVYVQGPNGQMVPTVQYGNYPGEMTHSDPVAVQGRVPTRYRVTQDVRQWTPQLNRWFSIGAPADAKSIDWSAIPVPAVENYPALAAMNGQELLPAIRSQLGPRAQAGVLATTGWVWTSGSSVASPQNQTYNRQYFVEQQLPSGVNTTERSLQYGQDMAAVERLSICPPQGLASLASSTSPHGGRSLDDVPVTTDGEADRWWLIVTVPQGDDIVVYRKAYRYSADAIRPMLSPKTLLPGR